MPRAQVKSVPNFAGTSIAYAYAVKAGPWVFLNGHEAFDFETGGRGAVMGSPSFPLWGPPLYRREANYVLNRMQGALSEFGLKLSDGVRLDQYYPTTAAVYPYHLARLATFGDYIPPSTSIVMERGLHKESALTVSLIAVAPSEEYRIGRVYPKDVGVPEASGFVPAVTCNDFVFVAGQMATSNSGDLDQRVRVPDFDRWAGSEIRKQTEFLILNKLQPALEAAGSSLTQAVKAQVYIDSSQDISEFFEVWNPHFHSSPCALTVVPSKNLRTVGGVLEINMLALRNDARRKKKIIEADLPTMSTYGPCIRAGEFLLPSAFAAVGADGRVVGAGSSLGLEALAHAGSTQAGCLYTYAEALCTAAGTSMENLLRAQYFVSSPTEFSGVAAAWISRYGSQPHPFACVQTPGPLPTQGAALIADFWIYAP